MNNSDNDPRFYEIVPTSFENRYAVKKKLFLPDVDLNVESAFSFRELIDKIKGDGSSSSSSNNSSSSKSGGSNKPGILGALGNIFSGLLGATATIAVGTANAAAIAAPAVLPILPALGIGSKSRINETKAQADAQVQLIQADTLAYKEKHENDAQYLMIAGMFILVIFTIYFALKD